jgi:hypothetical protein
MKNLTTTYKLSVEIYPMIRYCERGAENPLQDYIKFKTIVENRRLLTSLRLHYQKRINTI